MTKFWTNSLMGRLVTSFLLLSWLIVSLVAVVAYFRASNALERSVFERLEVAVTLKEGELNRWVNERRQDVLTIARSPEVQRQAEVLLDAHAPHALREAAYISLVERFNTMVIGKPDLREILIMDAANGQIVLSTDAMHEGQDRYTQPYFVQGQWATFVQNVYPMPEDGTPSMTISTPLFNEQGQSLGVVAVHLNLDQLDQIILERAGLGETGETYLIDRSNRFVSGQRFGREAFSQDVHSEGIDTALDGTDGAGLYRNYAEVPVIGVYCWVEDRELALLAEMHQQEAFAPARRLALAIFLVGLVSAVALAVGMYWLARQIVHPILAIAAAAARVTEGDLTQLDRASDTVPVLTQDEIGILARAFNQMIEQLRDLLNTLEQRVAARTRDLQIAADVSKQITTVLDIDEVLQRIVIATARSFDLYACLIFLIDDAHQQLVGTVGANAEGELSIQEGAVIPLDAHPSIIALAARTREPVVVADVRSSSAVSAGGHNVPASSIYMPVSTLPETRAELAIPMMRGDELMGVFDLQSRTVGHFDEEDLRVLTTLAEQIAIALRNAQLFAEAQEARRNAETASEAKSAFLANVSHELRTPLTSILGFTKIIQKRLQEVVFPAACGEECHKLSDEEAARSHAVETVRIRRRVRRAVKQVDANLNIVVSEAERLTALINDVLDLAKIEAGKLEWVMQPVSMARVIEQSLTEAGPLFEGEPLMLRVDVEEGLPSVLGDYDRLRQVVVNLISNAVKFTDEGEIRVIAWLGDEEGHCPGRRIAVNDEKGQRETRLATDGGKSLNDEEMGGDWVVVSVQDTGVGIASQDLGKVFEQFEQVVGDMETDKPAGTGLGLPICKHIVEYHGGRIWVESEPRQGSRFTFALPVFVAEVVGDKDV
jgi:signal transduction histidine kinase